ETFVENIRKLDRQVVRDLVAHRDHTRDPSAHQRMPQSTKHASGRWRRAKAAVQHDHLRRPGLKGARKDFSVNPVSFGGYVLLVEANTDFAGIGKLAVTDEMNDVPPFAIDSVVEAFQRNGADHLLQLDKLSCLLRHGAKVVQFMVYGKAASFRDDYEDA